MLNLEDILRQHFKAFVSELFVHFFWLLTKMNLLTNRIQIISLNIFSVPLYRNFFFPKQSAIKTEIPLFLDHTLNQKRIIWGLFQSCGLNRPVHLKY